MVSRTPDPEGTCKCGQRLAEKIGEYFVIQHKGRKMIVRDIITIRCEHCGRAWKPEVGVDE